MAPGAPATPPKSKVPAILLGVFGVMMLFGSCLPFGGAAFLYSEAESHRSSARYFESSGSGGYGGYGGGDAAMADTYRRSAVEEEQMSLGSGCCGSMCCLGSLGMLIGAAVMFSRAKR